VNYPRVLLAALALALCAGVLVAGVTSSAAFGAYNPAWDGTSELRSLADGAGVETTFVRPADGLGDPETGVAFALAPDPGTDAERLRRFAAEGGTVVVAADFGGGANPLLASMGASARIDGRLLRDEQRYYRGPAMPRATNVTDGRLVAGVNALTLNYGTGVEPGDARPLVRTSPYAYYDGNRNGTLDADESLGRRTVATTEALGEGRVVVVGDPSLFINAMLERNGNAAFARNLLAGADRLSLLVGDGALPPLVAALVTLRGSALLQALAGVGALGALALWVRAGGFGVAERLRAGADRLGAKQTTTAVKSRDPEDGDDG
jgi:hypothetical protein